MRALRTAAILILIYGMAVILNAVGLWQGARWARTFAMIFSGVLALSGVLGTWLALGIACGVRPAAVALGQKREILKGGDTGGPDPHLFDYLVDRAADGAISLFRSSSKRESTRLRIFAAARSSN